MSLRKLLLMTSLFIWTVVGYSASDQALSGAKIWESKYGQKAIDLKEWKKSNPTPYRARFGDGSSVSNAKRWYVSLGPLGLQTLMFDRSWCNLFSGFKKIMPKELSDSEGLVFNNFQVNLVKPGSPADGFIKEGDLILGMNDQLLKEAQLTYLGKNLGNRRVRGLEYHAGQLIDQSEGTGTISLTVLRAPKKAQKTIMDSLKGLRHWKTVQTVPKGEFSVTVANVDLLRFKAKKVQLSDLKLSNGEISYPVVFSIPKRMKMDNCRVPIPKGEWTLTGKAMSRVTIESINRVEFTPIMKKYIKIIKFPIVKIGSFNGHYNPRGQKNQNYSAILAKRLVLQQAEDGSWPVGGYASVAFPTAMVGLSLMAEGNPAYNENIKKAARFVAGQPFCKWAYPAGLRLMFLSEYYIRFKDPAVLKGIKVNLAVLRASVTADYVAGHGTSPGYGGGGYIGAGGPISCGLALAKLAGVASEEDVLLLDNMLTRVQQLAPDGAVPYGRARFNKKADGKIAEGQGTSCATGPYFMASLIRGGAALFSQVARKRYGYGPWGTAENGHATAAIHFTWGMLASANCSNKALIGSMNSALWQFTLYREFDGLINKNNSRTEYHNGDGVIGEPYWRTAGFLLVLNAYKRNLAITGMHGTRATKKRDTKQVFNEDALAYQFLKRNWFMVEAALGSKAPKPLTEGISQLLALPQDKHLGERLKSFYKKNAPSIARSVLDTGVVSKDFTLGELAELVFGISFQTSVGIDLDAASTSVLKPGEGKYGDELGDELGEGANPFEGLTRKEVKRAKKFKITSTAEFRSLEDKDNKEIKKIKNRNKSKILTSLQKELESDAGLIVPLRLTFKPTNRLTVKDGNKNQDNFEDGIFPQQNIRMSLIIPPLKNTKEQRILITQKDFVDNGTFSRLVSIPSNKKDGYDIHVAYTVGGVPIEYTTRAMLVTKDTRGYRTSLNIVRLPGTVAEDYRGTWTCRVKLKTGRTIGCEDPAYKPVHKILAGTPCVFDISPSGTWAHNIRHVKILNPTYRLAMPTEITFNGCNGDKKEALTDQDFDSICTVKKNSGNPFITYSFDTAQTITAVEARLQSNHSRKKPLIRIEAEVNGKWIELFSGTMGAYLELPDTTTTKIRTYLLSSKHGDQKIQELNFIQKPLKARSFERAKLESTW